MKRVSCAKAAGKRQAACGVPSTAGLSGTRCGRVWGSPQPVGAPRAGGGQGQGQLTVGRIGQKHLRPWQGTGAGIKEPVLTREC